MPTFQNKGVKNEFRLRHSALLLPLYIVLLLAVVYFGTHGLGTGFLIVFVVLLPCWVFLDFWHNVSYKDGIVTGVLFPHSPVSIQISDITNIRQEVDMFRLETRMCIAIHDDQNKKVVKVSLSVFVRDDIRKLMQIIHDARPDLVLPPIGRMGFRW
jgi:hypothetical protein